SVTSCAAQSIEYMLANEHLENQINCFKDSTAVKKFTSSIAHELNNPLDGVMRYVNICLGQVGQGSVLKEYMGEMQSGLKRMAEILRSMMEFSFAGDRNNNPVERDNVDVNNVLTDTIALYSYLARRNRIDIETDFATGLPQIRDCGLQQVFANFTQNAFDSIMRDGRLRIKSYQENESLCVEFIDNGVGVDEKVKDKIFDPFFTTKPTGKGLGLAIVREIVGCYNGEINVEGVSAGGACFTVKLPIGG
ncbi:MAG: HAMP domain-containing histidine kinase, partial [Candidatus Heimdallarchaeota archaeon]|nr:HAMP domain-containing histidine kinase [Candidatus Heimdallarchaeota archaeon]